MIKELKDKDGKRMVEQEEMKTHIFHHFKDIYMEKDETNPLAQADLLSGIPPLISEYDNKDLSKPIIYFEIKDAIWSLQVDKAPGPDEFTIIFYRAAWDIIKEDLDRMINWMRKRTRLGGHQLFLSHLDTKRKKNHDNRLL